jgi:cell division protein FtsB
MNTSRAADNFNSNDTNILQRKLQDLQAELAMLDNEHDSLETENKQMHDQNDRIK